MPILQVTSPQFRAAVVIVLTSLGVDQAEERWADVVIVSVASLGALADWVLTRYMACRETPPATPPAHDEVSP